MWVKGNDVEVFMQESLGRPAPLAANHRSIDGRYSQAQKRPKFNPGQANGCRKERGTTMKKDVETAEIG